MALNDIAIRTAKRKAAQYKLTDGGGLYLLVRPDGARYFRFNYRFGGKRRTLACGVYPVMTLAGARDRRDEARKMLASGIDPSAMKRAAKQQARLVVEQNTFEEIAPASGLRSSATGWRCAIPRY